MSKPGVIYRMKWDTVPVVKVGIAVASQVITANIYDTETLIPDDDDEVIYDLLPAMSPLVIQSIDNSEDKFTTIRAKQARIKFISNAAEGQEASLFFDSSDTRWKVVISCPFSTIFVGFLVIPDIQQDFLPDPNVVELTATDMLGSLSNQALVDFDGANPIGRYTLGQFIAMALDPTGLNLKINVVNNVRYYTGGTDEHVYENIFLDAKTWEASIGLSESCRTVLEKILGEDCVLFQWKGEWWIMRLDEIDDNLLYVAVFDTDGTLDAFASPINPTKPVGASSPIGHSDVSTTIRSDRRHKHVKLTYKYITPSEIICNMDFSRGDVITPPDISIADSTGIYDLDCWDFYKSTNTDVDQPPQTGAYGVVWKKFVFGVESDRFVVTQTAGGFRHYLKSQAMEVIYRDKLNISIGWRQENDTGGSGVYARQIMAARLFAENGDIWGYQYREDTAQNYWVKLTSAEHVWNELIYGVGDLSEDLTEWRTISADVPGVPATGKLYFYLMNALTIQLRYSAFRITYRPFINGSYELFTGQSTQVTSLTPTGIIQVREKEVFISDSPRKEFKGALLYFNGTTYILANQFYTANTFALAAPPSADYVHPFGHIQAYAVWNQYRNACRIFPSGLYGLFLDSLPNEWPDLIHKYQLADTNPNTDNRYFLIISLEQDWKTCKWRTTFVESYHRLIGHRYDDIKEFKYVTS